MESKIFINYRKEDSHWNALALYQELIKHFPRENIFKDFNTIEPGADFVESIEKALESCNVLLVLINDHWLTMKDRNGNIRLNNPDDFVRLEIATALKRGIRVIPVLFDNTMLPMAEELPDDLKSLARRQAIEIDNTRFETDTAKLIETIKSILGPDKKVEQPVSISINAASNTNVKFSYKIWLLIIAIAIGATGLSIYFLNSNSTRLQKQQKADVAFADSIVEAPLAALKTPVIDSLAAKYREETSFQKPLSANKNKSNLLHLKMLVSTPLIKINYKINAGKIVFNFHSGGLSPMIFVDVNQNYKIDENSDRVFWLKSIGTTALCAGYALNTSSNISCGSAPSDATLSLSNDNYQFIIPLKELQLAGAASISVQFGLFNASNKQWVYFPERNQATDFKKVYKIEL